MKKIILIVFLIPTFSFAKSIVMKCTNAENYYDKPKGIDVVERFFKFEKKLFSKPKIYSRWAGEWTTWCEEKKTLIPAEYKKNLHKSAGDYSEITFVAKEGGGNCISMNKLSDITSDPNQLGLCNFEYMLDFEMFTRQVYQFCHSFESSLHNDKEWWMQPGWKCEKVK